MSGHLVFRECERGLVQFPSPNAFDILPLGPRFKAFYTKVYHQWSVKQDTL